MGLPVQPRTETLTSLGLPFSVRKHGTCVGLNGEGNGKCLLTVSANVPGICRGGKSQTWADFFKQGGKNDIGDALLLFSGM